jgi:ribonuclease HII
VLVEPPEVDRRGVHAANIDGMRRAVARLGVRPGYVLTDGFAVSGFGVPALAVPKGDLAAACVAAASILAKVTRDRLMRALHDRRPEYGFDVHKGYCTPTHTAALERHGPSPDHRYSFVNVVGAARLLAGRRDEVLPADGDDVGAGAGEDVGHNGGDTMPDPDRDAEGGHAR